MALICVAQVFENALHPLIGADYFLSMLAPSVAF
jgi:hypothetical protein